MRRIGEAMFICILFIAACSNLSKNNQAVDDYLLKLLENNEYFKLSEELLIEQKQLADERLLYYKMHCANVFDNGKESNEYADILLTKYKELLHDTIIVEILEVKSNNYIRNYQYKEAANMYHTILAQYGNILDSIKTDEYHNEQRLNRTLESVKPQHIHLQNDAEIPACRNKFRHLMVPVKCGSKTDEFIFDTGAGLSTIALSYATKMNLTIYESNIDVWSSTDITISSKLAVADTLYVGGIMFENVVFLVMPDDQLSFPSVNYEIHGIIGFPVIHQMGEIRMSKDGTIKIPKEPQNKKLNNMYLNGLKPIVKVISENDTLLFILDTGASSSELYKNYYERHKSNIQASGELKIAKRGGAGGIVDVQEYELQNFPYKIGSKSNVLPKISVVISESTSNNKGTDGNLGQDVISQFNEMILNFKYMYIDFD